MVVKSVHGFGIDPQALEKLPVAPEKLFDGLEKKRLAESPGPRKETTFVIGDHLMNIFGLVGVNIIPLYDFPKRLIGKRKSFLNFHLTFPFRHAPSMTLPVLKKAYESAPVASIFR
jgi:hypothetical protein